MLYPPLLDSALSVGEYSKSRLFSVRSPLVRPKRKRTWRMCSEWPRNDYGPIFLKYRLIPASSATWDTYCWLTPSSKAICFPGKPRRIFFTIRVFRFRDSKSLLSIRPLGLYFSSSPHDGAVATSALIGTRSLTAVSKRYLTMAPSSSATSSLHSNRSSSCNCSRG